MRLKVDTNGNGNIDKDEQVVIRIINLTGQVVYESQNNLLEGDINIDISFDSIDSGMYFVNIQGDSFQKSIPFVKL